MRGANACSCWRACESSEFTTGSVKITLMPSYLVSPGFERAAPEQWNAIRQIGCRANSFADSHCRMSLSAPGGPESVT
jgi:hypothetical protein